VDEVFLVLDMDYLTNGWWLAITTISSVGYGGWPNTHMGRLVCTFLSVIGIFFMSLCIVEMTRHVLFTIRQSMSYWALKDWQAW
jgi:hypothetical protein